MYATANHQSAHIVYRVISELKIFESQLSDFENNVIKSQAWTYIASCHCCSVSLNNYFQKFPSFQILVNIAIQKLLYIIYEVYLVNNKFGELEHDANWQTFSLAKRMILSVDCWTNNHNNRDYN